MKAAMESADMAETAHTKNPRRKYFSPRSGMSSQRGIAKLQRKSCRPSRHRYSEIVPTGHSQLQKAFRNRNAIDKKAISKNIAAGWMAGTWPVTSQYFKFIKPAMGSQPSTPGGRETAGVCKPVS